MYSIEVSLSSQAIVLLSVSVLASGINVSIDGIAKEGQHESATSMYLPYFILPIRILLLYTAASVHDS
jgi:hypothetical protein